MSETSTTVSEPRAQTVDPKALRADGPERPIVGKIADRLDRGRFVTRLTDALIAPDTGQARGVVLGVTGPWGSGKSSVLNMLAEDISARYPKAIVVRFDPWIISGQQDLILGFLRETIAAIRAYTRGAKTVEKLLEHFRDYAGTLGFFIDIKAPGIGKAFSAGVAAFAASIKTRQESVTIQRKLLADEIVRQKLPIVVLIDELDRIDDAEVRAVAQLVRAVGDFPGISYVLAYDPDRVSMALGGGERGRAYLEKIVQLPIALPATIGNELRALLDAEVAAASGRLGYKTSLTEHSRYGLMAEALTPDLIATPRDIKRLIGVFHPLMAMVEAEIDAVDVLGFAALMVKAPKTADLVRQHSERYVDVPATFAEAERRATLALSGSGAVAMIDAEETVAWPLVNRLFPITTGHIDDIGRTNAISQRRNLRSVLKLGLASDELTAGEIVDLLSSPASVVATKLRLALEKDELSGLLDRAAEIYPERARASDLPFWMGASTVLNDLEIEPSQRFGLLNIAGVSLAEMLLEALSGRHDLAGKGNRILTELGRSDLVLVPRWLNHHVFVHRQFGVDSRRRVGRSTGWFLSGPETNNHVLNLGGQWRQLHLDGKLIGRLSNPYPLYLLVRAGMWDDQCAAMLQKHLAEFVGQFAALFYTPGGSLDPEIIETLCGLEFFVSTAERRLGEASMVPVYQAALKEALVNLRTGGSF